MGMLPVKCQSCRNSMKMLGLANAFSGGVFIAIALLHIMPESVEMWESLMKKQWLDANPGFSSCDCPECYPLPFLLIVFGYTLIFVFDKVIFDSHKAADQDK